MTSPHWEKIETGRYASELHGHTLQAIRRDRPYERTERPYVAVVDRVPIGDAWNLTLAKTKAIQYVEREMRKSKAESAFKNGRPAEAPIIPDPVDAMLVMPESVAVVEVEPAPEPSPEPAPEPAPEPSPVLAPEPQSFAAPGQLAITGRLTDADLLDALNAIRSTMELLREHAEVECMINLPPVLKL